MFINQLVKRITILIFLAGLVGCAGIHGVIREGSKFSKIKLDMPIKEVEALIGPATTCEGELSFCFAYEGEGELFINNDIILSIFVKPTTIAGRSTKSVLHTNYPLPNGASAPQLPNGESEPQLPERAQAPVVTWQTATELADIRYIAPQCVAAIADDPTIMSFPTQTQEPELAQHLYDSYGSRSDYFLRTSRDKNFKIYESDIEKELRLFGVPELSSNQFTKQEQIEKITALIRARVAQFKKTTKFCISPQRDSNSDGGMVIRGSYDLKTKSVLMAAGYDGLQYHGKNNTGKDLAGYGRLWTAEFAMPMNSGREWEETIESGGFDHTSRGPIIFTVPQRCPNSICEYEVTQFSLNAAGRIYIYRNGVLSLEEMPVGGRVETYAKFKRIK